VWQAILPVRMGLRPMKGDESRAEVQLSRTSFDALTGGRVADRVNGKSEAFDPCRRAFQPAFSIPDEFLALRRFNSIPCRRTRSRRNTLQQVEAALGSGAHSTGQAEVKQVSDSGAERKVGGAKSGVGADTSGVRERSASNHRRVSGTWLLQSAAPRPKQPLVGANGQSREGGLKGRLQPRLAATQGLSRRRSGAPSSGLPKPRACLPDCIRAAGTMDGTSPSPGCPAT
jgi:hypothetical protein